MKQKSEMIPTQRQIRATRRKLALDAFDRGDHELSIKLFGGNADKLDVSQKTLVTMDLPEDVLDEIRRKYIAEEINQAEISEQYGIHRTRVCLYCNQQGWTQERKNKHSRNYAKAAVEVASLIRQGLTEKEIMAQGYTPGHIKAARRLYKLKGTRGRKSNDD
ncbi:hypothetical protein [Enterococcus nangangensis]|uniref:hypothetical protein n=1 Tax=Enterococcus nangangensis TaxID=2559926 RepID=UPI001485B316|nr:hypothetical protein [Enterococcus nangangensis]